MKGVIIIENYKDLLPRQKAEKYGMSSLSDRELLALILKTGCHNKDVLQLSKELIETMGGISNICAMDNEEMMAVKGMGIAKAMELRAIIEICRRITSIHKVSEECIASSDEMANWIRFNIAFQNVEEFFVLYVSLHGSIIKSEVLFRGSRSSSIVGIDEILRRAVLLHADSIVIAHNHPSGSLRPSAHDISLTDKLNKSLSLIGLKLLDHIIVTRNDYFSMRKEGLIP